MILTKTPFALFDFDGTLAKGDSIVPFLLYCIRRGIAPKGQLFRAGWSVVRHRLHLTSASQAKSAALSYLADHSRDEIDALSRKFWRDVLSRRAFAEGLDEVRRLHDAGFHVLLVSASPECYLHVLKEVLPIDAVIATPCGLDAHDRYTGQLGENCAGVDKPLRIAEYLAAKHLTLDYDTSRAYGDSASDLPMLTLTASPIAVNPKPALRKALPDASTVQWR